MLFDTVFDPVLDVFRVVSVSRVVRSDWQDPCGQQVVVPVENFVGAVSKHPDRCGNGERVTCDAHRRLLVRLFSLCELRCYRGFCAGGDDLAEAVVVLLGGRVVVPRGSVVVLDRFDVGRIDGVHGVEQAAVRGLLNEPVEDVVDDVFEVGEKAINRVSGWWVVESAVPYGVVLEFSRDRTCAVDVLVVAV